MRRRLLVATTIAMIAIAVAVVARHERSPAPVQGLVDAAAMLDYRVTECRLSAGFPYRKLARREPDAPPLPLLAAAASVQRMRRTHVDPADLHALGLAHLQLQNWDEAAAALGDAIRMRTQRESWGDAVAASRDAALLADVAAAQHERGARGSDPRAHVLAAEAAERAWRIAKTPQTAWNRAIAIDALNLRGTAEDAWRDYLALDGDSAWAAEARSRLDRLHAPTTSASWESERARLERAVASGDTRETARIIRAYPSQSRRLCERGWVSEWAKSETPAALAHLAVCRAVGLVQRETAGESMLYDSIGQMDREPSAQLAAALALYHDAVQLYGQFRMTQARDRLGVAHDALDRAGSPLAGVARMLELNCSRYVADSAVLEESQAWLDARSFPWQRYRSLEAQVRWVRGLSLLRTGRPQAALQEYERALAIFDRLGEREYVTSMRLMISEVHEFVGDRDEAWRHRLATIEEMARIGNVQLHLVDVLKLCGAAAMEENLPLAAALFLDRQVALTRDGPYPDLLFQALLWRSAAHRAAGENSAAAADVAEAREAALRITDPIVRAEALQAPEVVQDRLSEATDPRERAKILQEAIASTREKGYAFRLSRLYLAQSREYASAHQWEGAIRVLLQSADELERQRETITDEERRGMFVSARVRVYEELAAAFCRAGEYERAFDALERGRARTLLDRVSRDASAHARLMPLPEIRARLPEDALLVSYANVGGRLAIWIVARDGIRFVEGLPYAEVARRADRFLLAIQHGSESETLTTSRALYEALIEPWEREALGRERLVVIGDELLARIPFAALRDGKTDQFLVQRLAISIAPSANVFAACVDRDRGIARSSSMALIVAPSRSGQDAFLAATRAEIAEVARYHQPVIVLEGDRATGEAFREIAPAASVIHFAGHAVTNRKSAARLVFAEGSVLRAEEIRSMRLPSTRLVVLAACAAGSEESGRSSQGVSSLARAFLAAGAPVVVASYRAVDDEVAASWSGRFHAALGRGLDPVAAVRAAQLEMIASGDPHIRSISAWASFAPFGATSQ